VCRKGYFEYIAVPNVSTPECLPCKADTYAAKAQDLFLAICRECVDPRVRISGIFWQPPQHPCEFCETNDTRTPPFCLCPPGSFINVDMQCAPCLANYVCAGAHTSPLQCPPSTLPVPTGQGRTMDDCVCTAGHFRGDDIDALGVAIAQNIVQAENAASLWCIPCPVGFFCGSGNATEGADSIVYACPAMTSTYAQGSASSSDCICAAGVYTIVAPYNNHTGGAAMCRRCARNHYCPGFEASPPPNATEEMQSQHHQQPAQQHPCPENTVSRLGTTSLRGCACLPPRAMLPAGTEAFAYDCVHTV